MTTEEFLNMTLSDNNFLDFKDPDKLTVSLYLNVPRNQTRPKTLGEAIASVTKTTYAPFPEKSE